MTAKHLNLTSPHAAAPDAGSEADPEAFAMPTATDSWDVVREPARGGVAYPALAALPGIEQVQAFLAGRAPAPSVARLTGRRITAASIGTATYTLPATDWMVGAKGVVHTGVLAVLADGALISSVVSALPARVLCTTAELSMTFLGTPPSARGDLTAHGRLLHLDREMALAEVHVHDAHDRLIAHGTSRCSVFPAINESIQLASPAGFTATTTEPNTPDPHLRTPPPAETARRHEASDGLQLLRAALRGELPHPPIDQLTGIRPVQAEEGRVVFAMPASPWLRNEYGTVYGGILTLLAKSAAAAAVQSTAGHGTRFTARDIKINFLRPVPADGHQLVATGTVLHRGTRLAIATAELMHGDDRVAVLTGTTALTPPPHHSTRRPRAAAAAIREPLARPDTPLATSRTRVPAKA